ncbi:MAG TPA: TrkH family potassium uptake protein, partial [Burkholderiales bacterium]
MIRIAVVLNLLAVLLMIFAAAMALPLGMSLVLGDHAELVHAEALYFTGLSGALLWMLTRRARSELQTRDGFVFVVLVWTVLPAFATLPLLGYLHGLTFTDAYFEAMSGLTATGAT